MLSTVSNTSDWHESGFMAGASPEEKEAWLELLLSNRYDMADVDAFLVVLNAFGDSTQSGAPQRAEHWIIRLEKETKEQERASKIILQPTVPCYLAVMKAWANAVHEDRNVAAIRTERWLNAMYERNLQPTTECYNILLDACSCGRGHTNRRSDTTSERLAMKSEELLDFMLEQFQKFGKSSPIIPNTDSFNYVLRAWTRCRRHPKVGDRVTHLLKYFQNARTDEDVPFVRPNTKSYCMALDAIAITARMKVHRCPEASKSDVTKNGLQEIQQMEHIIEYMHHLHTTGSQDVTPSTVAYNTLLSAWARLSGPVHPEAPFRAEAVLRRMISLKNQGLKEAFPDATSYIQVILAWRNSERVNAGERAAWWLRKQWQDFMFTGNPALQPKLHSYNSLIQTWAKLERPVEAEDVLTMLLDHEKEESSGLTSDSESFAFVIQAWLKSVGNVQFPTGQCFERALYWLDEAIARESAGVKTPSTLFLSFLTAARKCAWVGPVLLEKVAVVFDKYRESPNPIDFNAYSLLLHVGLDTLNRPEHNDARTHFVTRLMESAREDGLVSSQLVRTLANSRVYAEGWTKEESARLTNELFHSWPIPHSWMRNVPTAHHPDFRDTRRTNSPRLYEHYHKDY